LGAGFGGGGEKFKPGGPPIEVCCAGGEFVGKPAGGRGVESVAEENVARGGTGAVLAGGGKKCRGNSGRDGKKGGKILGSCKGSAGGSLKGGRGGWVGAWRVSFLGPCSGRWRWGDGGQKDNGTGGGEKSEGVARRMRGGSGGAPQKPGGVPKIFGVGGRREMLGEKALIFFPTFRVCKSAGNFHSSGVGALSNSPPEKKKPWKTRKVSVDRGELNVQKKGGTAGRKNGGQNKGPRGRRESRW